MLLWVGNAMKGTRKSVKEYEELRKSAKEKDWQRKRVRREKSTIVRYRIAITGVNSARRRLVA